MMERIDVLPALLFPISSTCNAPAKVQSCSIHGGETSTLGFKKSKGNISRQSLTPCCWAGSTQADAPIFTGFRHAPALPL
eukprot:1614547-Rhodomonas_salina.1